VFFAFDLLASKGWVVKWSTVSEDHALCICFILIITSSDLLYGEGDGIFPENEEQKRKRNTFRHGGGGGGRAKVFI
jgi:hypothetical protein